MSKASTLQVTRKSRFAKKRKVTSSATQGRKTTEKALQTLKKLSYRTIQNVL